MKNRSRCLHLFASNGSQVMNHLSNNSNQLNKRNKHLLFNIIVDRDMDLMLGEQQLIINSKENKMQLRMQISMVLKCVIKMILMMTQVVLKLVEIETLNQRIKPKISRDSSLKSSKIGTISSQLQVENLMVEPIKIMVVDKEANSNNNGTEDRNHQLKQNRITSSQVKK